MSASTTSETSEAVLEEIPPDECLRLLAGSSLGRLAIVDGRQPIILPVNYVYTEDGIVVRTDDGVKLDAGAQHLVALEIDEIDVASRVGWSVLVKGHSFDVTDTLDERSERLQQVDVETWAPGPKSRRMLVEVTTVTGRRLSRTQETASELAE